jgi:hypothetical protein
MADVTTDVEMLSPSAAIQRADPVGVTTFIVSSWVNENCPRCVPVPVAFVVSKNVPGEGPGETVSLPSNLPLKGTCGGAPGTSSNDDAADGASIERFGEVL